MTPTCGARCEWFRLQCAGDDLGCARGYRIECELVTIQKQQLLVYPVSSVPCSLERLIPMRHPNAAFAPLHYPAVSRARRPRLRGGPAHRSAHATVVRAGSRPPRHVDRQHGPGAAAGPDPRGQPPKGIEERLRAVERLLEMQPE